MTAHLGDEKGARGSEARSNPRNGSLETHDPAWHPTFWDLLERLSALAGVAGTPQAFPGDAEVVQAYRVSGLKS